MNRACQIVVESWQYNVQFASSNNIASQMKNDLGSHGLEHPAYRGNVLKIGVPPSEILADSVIWLTRYGMNPRATIQESVTKMRTDEAAAACHQH
jgi:hypothetical protein